MQVYSLCQGEYNASFRWAYTSFFSIQNISITSFKYIATFLFIQYVEAPEANILVCKGYKCTKNQALDYILLQNQVISSNNYQQQLSGSQQQSSHSAPRSSTQAALQLGRKCDMLIGIMQSSIYDINHTPTQPAVSSIKDRFYAFFNIWYQSHSNGILLYLSLFNAKD